MSGKKKIVWELSFHLKSDWLIKGASQSDNIDHRPLVDGLNQPYIPASTIKGMIRHEFKKLTSFPLTLPFSKTVKDYEDMLFGKSGSENGQLYFKDAVIQNYGEYDNQVRTRIAIDRNRRVVKDEALLFEEVTSRNTKLHGQINCFVKDEEQEIIAALIALCILNIRNIGSNKSIGRGEVQFIIKDAKDQDGSKSILSIELEKERSNNYYFESWSKENFTSTVNSFVEGVK